ncbi:MAG: BrnT family toxin [Deltaproteobacteria bacterium]|nr:BrnT family toxin [Deltaproteobacteria bacterium]MBI4373518.1 BrnT family toxin [Deltaproteobacteria bacterium]
MEFEFDAEKSRFNREKHGIDFVEAQNLWNGPSIEFAANQEYENRFAIIGSVGEKLYTCIYTLRGDKIRIISCRRSREKERRLYEENARKTKER